MNARDLIRQTVAPWPDRLGLPRSRNVERNLHDR